MTPPGSDFYSAVAQLVPLLLIAVAVEERRFGSDADPDDDSDVPLELGVVFLAVIAEIGALAGLTGYGGRTAASVAADGLGVLGTVLAGSITLRFVPEIRTRGGIKRVAGMAMAATTAMAPVVVAVIYSARLLFG